MIPFRDGVSTKILVGGNLKNQPHTWVKCWTKELKITVVERTETASAESALSNKLEDPDQFAEGCHRATYQNKS